MPDLAGHCPICRTEMFQRDSFVVCPEGDYKAVFSKWDEIWSSIDDILAVDEDSLFNALLALNLVDAKNEPA